MRTYSGKALFLWAWSFWSVTIWMCPGRLGPEIIKSSKVSSTAQAVALLGIGYTQSIPGTLHGYLCLDRNTIQQRSLITCFLVNAYHKTGAFPGWPLLSWRCGTLASTRVQSGLPLAWPLPLGY